MLSGGCNEYAIVLILVQLVLKLVRKLKASLWVQIFPNDKMSHFYAKLTVGSYIN